jgi:hypothetical protein
VVNKINLLHKPLLRYQYFNDSIKNKKWHFFDFEITTCKTTRKRQKEGQFTTPVPVEPEFFTYLWNVQHQVLPPISNKTVRLLSSPHLAWVNSRLDPISWLLVEKGNNPVQDFWESVEVASKQLEGGNSYRYFSYALCA